MLNDTRPVTLVVRNAESPSRNWETAASASSRVIFVEGFRVLSYALGHWLDELSQDVHRVVIDQSATPLQVLDLLANLPDKFLGDLLYVHGDERAFLSTVGRGGCRILYALDASDVQFYLETQSLLSATPNLISNATDAFMNIAAA